MNDSSLVMTSFTIFIVFAGGGDKKIASQKLEWKGQSKVGSIDNIKHRPGGGNIKVNWIRPFWLMNNSAKLQTKRADAFFSLLLQKGKLGAAFLALTKVLILCKTIAFSKTFQG